VTRFVLLTHGTRGDVDPFAATASGLVRRGHRVSVLTHAPYESVVRSTGADFHPVDDGSGYEAHLRRTAALVAVRPAAKMGQYYRDSGLFLDRLARSGGLDQIRREVDTLLELCRDGEPTVLVGRHTSSLSGLIAAEVTGSPVCQVALSPSQLLTAPVAALHLARAVGPEINAIRAGFGLTAVTRWSSWLTGADLTIGMWPAWFDQAGEPSGSPVLLTGFPLGDSASSLRRADAGPAAGPALSEGTVLVTGGTGRMLHEDFYPAALDGLAAARMRAVVVTPYPDLLPKTLPPGVVHVLRLPFAQILPGVAGIVHHGGIGVSARALVSGVPQLVLAHGGDRPDNGARLAGLGLAVSLKPADWTPDRIAPELAALLTPRRRGEAENFAARLRASELADPAEAVVDALVALAAGRPPASFGRQAI
jgi:rhamnosyltransferase subunit B